MNLHSDTTTPAVNADRPYIDRTGDKPGEIALETGVVRAPFSRPSMRAATEVIELVCREWGVTAEALKSKDRHRNIVSARQVACWLLRETRRLSYPEIGVVMNKDHTTAISAVKKVDRWVALDGEFRELVERLRLELDPPVPVPGFETGRHV